MNIAIMLAARASSTDRDLVRGLVESGRRRGHVVRLFLLGDGVLDVDLGVAMAAAGAEVSLCEADAAQRGLHKSDQAGVYFGSLYDWARLAEDADRLVSLS